MNLKKHSQVKSQNFQFWPFSPIHSPIARRARVSTRLGSTSIFRALPSPRAAFIFHLQPALSILRHFPFRSFDRFFFNLTSSARCSRPSCSVRKLFRLLWRRGASFKNFEQYFDIINRDSHPELSTKLSIVKIYLYVQLGYFPVCPNVAFGQKLVLLHSYIAHIK